MRRSQREAADPTHRSLSQTAPPQYQRDKRRYGTHVVAPTGKEKQVRKSAIKLDLPVWQIRRYLEPGPIVLVSSALDDKRNIMTMGWHTVMEFTPSLIGCVIARGNHSFDLIRKSRECVINLPTTALTDTVVGVGNTAGSKIDKFAHFGLTVQAAERVTAPMIAECHANFECRLADDVLIDKYNFFVFEVVKAHVAKSPNHPETLHYTGDGVFMVSGKVISRRSQFRPGML
jgi:flavin reductase (DIM6/NTAB) family NADH-FMN oxidoreductase RutF